MILRRGTSGITGLRRSPGEDLPIQIYINLGIFLNCMQKLPVGVQDFMDLRASGYLYVDKTEYYHRLITSGKYYFISRPRRFGKSLMLSTIRYLFQGERDLFKGLWIYDRWDWGERYPVISLDMGKLRIKSAEDLEERLEWNMDYLARKNGIELSARYYSDKFGELLDRLHEKLSLIHI